jgi:CRISPR-associated endonuclease Cas3-HD
MRLEAHLLGVADRAADAAPGHEDATSIARICGLCHDVGKATPWFQAKIGNGDDDVGPTHHSRLGSLLTYHVLREREYPVRKRCAAAVAVAKHHGSVPDIERFVMDRLHNQSPWRTKTTDTDLRLASTDGSARNAHAAQQAMAIDEHAPDFARACMVELFPDRTPDAAWTWFLDQLTASVNPGRPDGTDSLLGALHEDLTRMSGRRPAFDSSLRGDGALYTDLLQLYGTLTFADKTHAAGIDCGGRLEAAPLKSEAVRSHLEELAAESDASGLAADLNGLRAEIQGHLDGVTDGEDPVKAFLESPGRIASLSLPTGYGKTLAGLLTASRIREATGGERIIYALPFTSIIDQAAEVIGDVVRPDADQPSLGRELTVHHHLAESLTLPAAEEDEDNEETDEDAGRATMLAESWRAGVTLSTFVQLFESTAGPSNAQSMKLPALEDSVVIIDEPQALPLGWWPLVERLLEALTTEYDATVLLMTATQPRIVSNDATDVLVDAETLSRLERRCFDRMPERVSFRFDQTALTESSDESALLGHAEAAERVVDDATAEGQSVLAVCNTIDSVNELYNEVVSACDRCGGYIDVPARYDDALAEPGGDTLSATDPEEAAVTAFAESVVADADSETPAVLSLSTRIRPRDRGTLFAVARQLIEADIPFILTSTQLVEAGVDVSFGRVFRDFAPLDSIVQVAGRCNRSYEFAPEPGRVTVWQLGPPSGKSAAPSEAVYARRRKEGDLDLLQPTRAALDEADVAPGMWLPEAQVSEASIERYQRRVGEAVRTVASDNSLRTAYQDGDGVTLRQASIIDSRFSFEVYVPRTATEVEQVEALSVAIAGRSFDEARQLRDDLAGIRVSVPVYSPESDTARELLNLPALVDDELLRDTTERVWRPGSGRFERYFDPATGFAVPEQNVEARFL